MSIEQEVTIGAAAQAVFDLLLSSARFAEMSGGAPADISTETGGAVSLFGGAIEARNIEVLPGKRLVQTWRSADWPEGVHSIIRFELKAGEGDNTLIAFSQSGHPDDATPHLKEGWHQMYWTPMNALLAGK